MKPPKSSEVTPESLYLRRREFLKNAGLFAGTASAVGAGLVWLSRDPLPPGSKDTGAGVAESGGIARPAPEVTPSAWKVDEAMTSEADVTSYNNYYEFGTGKADPARFANTLVTRPWTVAIEGEVESPQVVDIDALLKWAPLEERVYQMRCVEAWSMVIPWLGFPLSAILERVKPTSKARYVAFETLADPKQMPEVGSDTLDWPYIEGLRLDEAMHPLTLMAVGLYGKWLPNQNGAPLRLVVPWKYGFKGIKSIVKIRLTETQPRTTWNLAASNEYGFYANVNPKVDHPRWSQATERRIGELRRRPTLPFNGYAEEVASLYRGMDLQVNY